jgi:hypothetical protein
MLTLHLKRVEDFLRRYLRGKGIGEGRGCFRDNKAKKTLARNRSSVVPVVVPALKSIKGLDDFRV